MFHKLKRERPCENHPFNESIRVENLQILDPSTESIYLIHPQTNSQMLEGSTEDTYRRMCKHVKENTVVVLHDPFYVGSGGGYEASIRPKLA